jgi:histidine ammonia-lyase
MNKLIIDGNSLSLESIEEFLSGNQKVKLSPTALAAVKRARALVEKWTEMDSVIYGVTTGFGEFANVRISHDKIKELQENLILSHSVGCGENLPPFIVKIMMLLRLNALAKGNSGIRPETLDLLTQYDKPQYYSRRAVTGLCRLQRRFGSAISSCTCNDRKRKSAGH